MPGLGFFPPGGQTTIPAGTTDNTEFSWKDLGMTVAAGAALLGLAFGARRAGLFPESQVQQQTTPPPRPASSPYMGIVWVLAGGAAAVAVAGGIYLIAKRRRS